jgi:hypothetical protein
MDDHHINGGIEWESEVELFLSKCKVFVVIVLEASNWVCHEKSELSNLARK